MILGQDPYFRKGQAHGLAFSVRKGVTVPPSLNRIYNVPPSLSFLHVLTLCKGITRRSRYQGIQKAQAWLPPRMGFARSSHAQCLVKTSTLPLLNFLLMPKIRLTVREGKPNSHEKCGWQTFTDAIIKYTILTPLSIYILKLKLFVL